MENKQKNYVVMKSIFGDYWVGFTYLPADEKRIFTDFEMAKNKSLDLFFEKHWDFDPDADPNDEADYDPDLAYAYEDLESATEEECEEVTEELQKFMV